jgi:hypothetical protein
MLNGIVIVDQVSGVRCQAKQNLILVAAELNPQNITVWDFPDT